MGAKVTVSNVGTRTGAIRRMIAGTSGVRYTDFSYHDIGAIFITIRYIHLWFEITMKHYYEVND